MKNLRTVAIWLAVGSASCFGMAMLPNEVLLRMMPISAWNVLALVAVILATSWLIVAVLHDDSNDEEQASPTPGRSLRNAALRWILPPPPAARRAYAHRTQRTRKEVL